MAAFVIAVNAQWTGKRVENFAENKNKYNKMYMSTFIYIDVFLHVFTALATQVVAFS